MTIEFSLDEEQTQVAEQWICSHECELESNSGELARPAVGAGITYKFIPTSIGLVVVIDCACGEYVDLTNYAEW